QQDDDGDGKVDYPNDPGCQSAFDDFELNACKNGTTLLELTDAGQSGTIPTGASQFAGSCASPSFVAEQSYGYLNTRSLARLFFSTQGSSGDTVLYVRHGDCTQASSEVACKNASGGGEQLVIEQPDQSYYYVFVDGAAASGFAYQLAVFGEVKPGAACT